ncbi:peptide chain release factor N(5)-glutamine methyltransferase [Salana multivorans]
MTGAERPSVWGCVRGAAVVLGEAGVPSPEVDARLLAEHVLGVSSLVMAPAVVPDGFVERYAELVERRRRREPLQHLTGTAAFRYLELEVRPGVFVPRPETEVVAQHAIDAARASGPEPLVADLCCGAGGIALAVATEVPGARVVAVDASPDAVALTRDNAAGVGASRVEVLLADVRDPGLLAELNGRIDVVVSNPPYIPPDAVPQDPEVRDHDPDLALYGGGPDGLEVPRGVVAAALRLLRPGGGFVMEHAEVQASAVREIVAAAGFVDVVSFQDLTGRDRGVLARRPG